MSSVLIFKSAGLENCLLIVHIGSWSEAPAYEILVLFHVVSRGLTRFRWGGGPLGRRFLTVLVDVFYISSSSLP